MKNDWPNRQIKEICVFRGGGTPSKSNRRYWSGDIPWVSPKDMKVDVISDSIDHISPEAIAESATNLIPEGSILVVIRSGILARTVPVAITGRELAINQDIKALCPDRSIEPKFLFYFLKSRLEEMLALASRGATVHRIMVDQIRTMSVPVPSRTEQQRIVGFLQEAFDCIAIAKAKAEKNLQNARDILNSCLETEFKQASRGWPARRLGEVMNIGSSKRIMEREWTSTGVPFYGGREVVKLAKGESFESDAFISEDKYREIVSNYGVPWEGDIMMTARGTIGVGYIVNAGDKFYYKDGNLMCLQAKVPLNPSFILYAFRTSAILEQLRGLSGTTVTHLPIEKANTLNIAFPEKFEQDLFVARMDRVGCEAKRLESVYQKKLIALDELKKSLLHRAFSGQL